MHPCSHADMQTEVGEPPTWTLQLLPMEDGQEDGSSRLFALVNAPMNLSAWKRKTGACLCPIPYPSRDRELAGPQVLLPWLYLENIPHTEPTFSFISSQDFRGGRRVQVASNSRHYQWDLLKQVWRARGQ